MHSIINANEFVPCDVKFTSAATHDHFLLCPSNLKKDEIIALDRAYVNYEKFEQMTQKGIVYVTKMKKNLVFNILEDKMFQTHTGQMALRVQEVVFKPKNKNITHKARIITYPDVKKKKLISLLTNDFDMSEQDIIDIYRKRWMIESLFKQLNKTSHYVIFMGKVPMLLRYSFGVP